MVIIEKSEKSLFQKPKVFVASFIYYRIINDGAGQRT
jgi:hypothetical protein